MGHIKGPHPAIVISPATQSIETVDVATLHDVVTDVDDLRRRIRYL